MSDQNRFDEYKEKFVHYWLAFLGLFGKLWDSVKEYLGIIFGIIADWLRPLTEKLSPIAKKVWEKISGWISRAGEWLAGLMAKFHKEKPAAAVQAPAAEAEQIFDQAAAEPAAEKSRDNEAANNTRFAKTLAVLAAIGNVLKLIVTWIWKLRTVFMAIPVVWAAVKLAMENMERLPESVGLDLQSTGEFARMITREEAVYWPLGITAFCLLLMFCAKKPLLPWVISIFSLVLPLLVWLTNYLA